MIATCYTEAYSMLLVKIIVKAKTDIQKINYTTLLGDTYKRLKNSKDSPNSFVYEYTLVMVRGRLSRSFLKWVVLLPVLWQKRVVRGHDKPNSLMVS